MNNNISDTNSIQQTGRREFIQKASLFAMALSSTNMNNLFKDSKMGIVVHSYGFRWNSKIESKNYPGFMNALDLLEHCAQIGSGGIQVVVKDWTSELAKKLKDRKEKLGMFIEGSIGVPNGANDVARFERELKTAKDAGVLILRTVCSSGRRYEVYHSAEEFKTAKQKALTNLQLAEPILKKHKMKLAIENHKDWRATEHVKMIKQLQSEWIGVTLDFGNSIALLEDPMEIVNTLAPYAFSTHLKDMGLEEYADGFLLSEVPLGQGILNLPEMMAVVKKHNPDIKFSLEMITRDPLEIPCLKETYWSTFEDVPATDLARSLRMVKQHKFKTELPRISKLGSEAKLDIEEKNILECLAYSKTNLGLN
ncbi:MAG: TIM barrel protein [Saprospiraceae bacterium]